MKVEKKSYKQMTFSAQTSPPQLIYLAGPIKEESWQLHQ